MSLRACYFLFTILTLALLAAPSEAFGAGYVSSGSHLRGNKFRHGDIALAIPLLATANRRIVKQIYFGNWLRDFSQLLDKGSLALVPYPLLRALVAVFAFVQFGYSTREFEVTNERLGVYRPEEHVDNPKGYVGNDASTKTLKTTRGGDDTNHNTGQDLRSSVHPAELSINPDTGMKNYIRNAQPVEGVDTTSADYVEKQLIAAISCGRQCNMEAYTHLGTALHTLEDFLAHSNYIELALQMIGSEVDEKTKHSPALRKVYAFVGGKARLETAGGIAAPITTGSFGALDLCQTLLGEVEDKASAVSLPGLEIRTPDSEGPIQKFAKYLIGLLGELTPDFEGDILKVQKGVTNAKPADWGELQEKPEKLWENIEPVLKLRDDVAKWINDHLKIQAVQDALASVSAAIDKLVYMVLGIFFTPLLKQFRKALKNQEQRLLIDDQKARQSYGEQSIFDASSRATDPTHSQLAKDHYDHALNEIAGRIAARVSSYTVTGVVQLWQPGNTQDPRQVIRDILNAFHHPCNATSQSTIQSLMIDEVRAWIHESIAADANAFETTLESLSHSAIASRMAVDADMPGGHHTHVDDTNKASRKPNQNGDSLPDPGQQNMFMRKVSQNIKDQVDKGVVKGLSGDDFLEFEKLLFASPSGDSPNPLDTALSKLPGLSFLNTFKGIEIDQIAAAEGFGETTKDAVITMILLDETRGVEEGDVAATRFGWGRTDREKEEKLRLKELKTMLEIPKTGSSQEEGQSEEKTSAGEKMKLGFEKLKLKTKR